MNARSRRWFSVELALCWSLLVLVSIFPSGYAAAEGDQRTSAVTTQTSPPMAKSPKELALADFLRTMKLEGRPVLIEFGLVGCELSDKGLDSMMALHRDQTVPGLALVRVEGNPDASAVERYFAAKAPPFPVYRDTGSTLATSLGANVFPTFVLADKFGHIRYTGKYPQDNVAAWGKTLVEETRDPGSQVALFGARTLDVPRLLAAKLPDLKDTPRALSEYRGAGGLMVLFVDTKCPYSAVALKEMPTIAKALADRNINAVALNNDDDREKVHSYYAQNAPGVPVLYDVGKATREAWNVQSVPTAVYISPAGKVAYQGEAVWANMGSAIDASLGLAPGTTKFTAAGTGFG